MEVGLVVHLERNYSIPQNSPKANSCHRIRTTNLPVCCWSGFWNGAGQCVSKAAFDGEADTAEVQISAGQTGRGYCSGTAAGRGVV